MSKAQHCNDPDCPGIPRCPCLKQEYYDRIEQEELQAENFKKLWSIIEQTNKTMPACDHDGLIAKAKRLVAYGYI